MWPLPASPVDRFGRMDIITGTLDDLDSLRELWDQMLEHHREVMGAQLPVRPLEESWPLARAECAGWLTAGSAVLLIARQEGAAVGYLLCRLAGSGTIFDLGRLRGDIDTLVVSHQARGAGVGTALLTACRAELVSRGCTHWTIGVVATNPEAERLYERLGFRPWIHELAAPLDA
jgi:ribosomal protein S18 acetylase RimI-like enzyme